MISQRSRTGFLATALALLLSTAALAPAAAADGVPRRAWSAEKYALSLLNCTRTGGWVKAGGKCKARGSGKFSAKRAPLKRSRGISKKVAFPWARSLTAARDCGHALPGEPALGQRFSIGGFSYAAYSENVGCGWGGATPKQVILSTHRLMQAEKSYGGGHWLNMKSATYKSVGVGVATYNGRTTVVYDFYGKRAY